MPDAPTVLSPTPLTWPGVVVIVILAVFLAAAVLGPLIQANMQDELHDQDREP